MKLFGALTALALAVAVPSMADVCLPPRPARPAMANIRTAQHFLTAPGTVMPDGTVFAGYLGDGTMLYTTRCDAGQSWSGSACTGTRLSKTWSSGNTTTGFTSATNGAGNTAGLVALSDAGAPYQAAVYCDGLTDSGHSDWYLPARDEMIQVGQNHGVIQGFTSSWYATSSEASSSGVWAVTASPVFSIINSGGKGGGGYYVRCVRR